MRALTFLGFNIRRCGGKLLIKPSKAAVRRIRNRLRSELWSLRGSNAQAVIKRLNPIIRGWAAYYRTQVSGELFNTLDGYLWRLTYKWAIISHANQPKRWVVDRYFGRFNRSRRDRWVFGDRESGAHMHKFAWTKIVRHQIVKGAASADDPALAEYWAWRRRKTPCRSTAPACGCTKPRPDTARSAGPRSSPSTTRRRARPSGNGGWRPPGRRPPSSPSGRTAHRARLNPVSYTPTAAPDTTPATAHARHRRTPTEPSGLA
jgi:hypothetical protein